MKSKSTAIIWCFFLGGLGAHKFYLGQAGLGVLYILFFWTFIPAFVAFMGSDLKRDKSKSVQSENEIRIKP
jgi:TM2 domain-containing membrane protein YozV